MVHKLLNWNFIDILFCIITINYAKTYCCFVFLKVKVQYKQAKIKNLDIRLNCKYQIRYRILQLNSKLFLYTFMKFGFSHKF